jgi:hypothetical protein
MNYIKSRFSACKMVLSGRNGILKSQWRLPINKIKRPAGRPFLTVIYELE